MRCGFGIGLLLAALPAWAQTATVSVDPSAPGAAVSDQILGMNMANWFDPTQAGVAPPLPPGVAASSVPPPIGRAPGLCANCGTPLHGPFCSNCGQHIRDLHRSTWRFVADFFENAFSWDNKLVLTLEPLLKRPGALTLDYLSGHRVRYVHPLRLFLFTSAICLAIIEFLGGSLFGPLNIDFKDKQPETPKFEFHVGDPSPARPPAKANPAPTAPADTAARAGRDGDDDGAAAKSTKDLANALNLAADKVRQSAAAGSDPDTSPLDKNFGDDIARKVKARIKADGGTQRMRKEFTENVGRRASWVALALLPIFAAMLRGLYWRRDGYYFAHFVFSLHYHTFLLLFIASYTLVQLVLPTSFWPVRTLLHATACCWDRACICSWRSAACTPRGHPANTLDQGVPPRRDAPQSSCSLGLAGRRRDWSIVPRPSSDGPG